jgi:hypothetical protein
MPNTKKNLDLGNERCRGLPRAAKHHIDKWTVQIAGNTMCELERMAFPSEVCSTKESVL